MPPDSQKLNKVKTMLNRRDFMKAGIVVAGSLSHPNLWAATTSQPQKKMIVVLLRGAMDGLNVVVPYADADYYKWRPKLAFDKPNANTADSVIDLDGFFGINPTLKGLLPLWNDKQLAFIHASGSKSRSRSHFDAQYFMETATPDSFNVSTGWLNRLLMVLNQDNQNMQSKKRLANQSLNALIFSAIMPRIAMGNYPLTLISPGQAVGKNSFIGSTKANQLFDGLYSGNSSIDRAYQEAQASQKALQETVNAQTEESKIAANGGKPVSGFAKDARQLAMLMRQRDDIGFGFFGLSGWDTHVGQGKSKGVLASSLTSLSNGLIELQQGLQDKWQDTVVVVMSEFGRTARENGYGGTDHGHGNVMWVLGGNVQGKKVYGTWPGLAEQQLFENRDLAVTTDFRDVLVNILQQHYQLNTTQLKQIFPDYDPTDTLNLLI